MSDDISLLPEKMREREEELKKVEAPRKKEPASIGMHVPKAEEEDIEVIEVDEGEVGDVLGNEPFLTRTLFKAQSAFEGLSDKLFHPQKTEPPPKLPPQFFKPPTAGAIKKTGSGLVPIAGAKPVSVAASQAPVRQDIAPAPVEAKPKARIIPAATTPRRVRVIKRVRKPVQVSFLEDEGTQIDIPRRRFTLITTIVVFVVLFAGGYGLIGWQGKRAQTNLDEVNGQLTELQAKTTSRKMSWDTFKDLEPRLKALAALLDRHLSPSKVFDALEIYTVSDVYYSNFTLTPDGHVSLAATAPSFEAAARQIVSFEESGLVKKVQALGYQTSYNTLGKLESVTFQINLTLEPSVLKASQPLKPLAAR